MSRDMHDTFLQQLFRVVVVVCKDRDPIWADITMFIHGDIFFQILPVLQPTAFHWHLACVQRHSPQSISCEVHIPLIGQPDLASRHGLLVACLQTNPACGCRSEFGPSGVQPKSNHFILWSDQNRILFLVPVMYVCGHGMKLLTKEGSKKGHALS